MECLASDVTQVVVCGGFFQKQGEGDKQTDKQTDRRTLRLYERIGQGADSLKTMEEAEERMRNTEKENKELTENLENARKTIVEVIETRNTLIKVVELIGNNFEVKKTKKVKEKIPCRDFNKPGGCAWGDRCRFRHGEDPGLEKDKDCSYWMAGHCRYSEKVCWNSHNPEKKGMKPIENEVATR